MLNNENFVSSSFDFTIKLWSKFKFEMLTSIKVISQPYFLIGLQNDSGIAYGDSLRNIYILDSNSLITKITIKLAHKSTIVVLAIDPYGNLSSASSDIIIKIWDKITFNFIKILLGFNSFVNSLIAIKPNILLGGSADKTIRIWNTNKWELIQICQGKFSFNNLILLQDGVTFASASDDGIIEIWEKKCV